MDNLVYIWSIFNKTVSSTLMFLSTTLLSSPLCFKPFANLIGGVKNWWVPSQFALHACGSKPPSITYYSLFHAEHEGTCQHPKILLCTHMKAWPSKQRKTPDSINYWVEKGEGTVHVSSPVCCQRQGETGKQRNAQELSKEREGGSRM